MILAVAGRLQDNYAGHAARLGLTGAQSKVLMAMQSGRAISMRALAQRIGLDPANLTGVVDRLEESGLLVRQPSAVDRRVKELVLTPRGERVRIAFWTALTSDAGPLAALSAEELEGLRRSLAPLAAAALPSGARE
jgi:DNA-binding MarR family transcriptional regulator